MKNLSQNEAGYRDGSTKKHRNYMTLQGWGSMWAKQVMERLHK